MKKLLMKWRRVLGVVLAVAIVFSYSPLMHAYAEYADAGDLSSQPTQEDTTQPEQGEEEPSQPVQEEETAPSQEETQPSNPPSVEDNPPSEDGASSQPQDEGTDSSQKPALDETQPSQPPAAEGEGTVAPSQPPVCTCGSESDVHTEGCPLYVPPKADPVQDFLDAVADLQKFQEDEGDDAEKQLALERAVIDGYDALSDEQKDYLGGEYAEMVKTLRDGVNPLTLNGKGTADEPYIINNGGDLWNAINASKDTGATYYFKFQSTVTVNQSSVWFNRNTVLTGSGGLVRGGLDETVPLVTVNNKVTLSIRENVIISNDGKSGALFKVPESGQVEGNNPAVVSMEKDGHTLYYDSLNKAYAAVQKNSSATITFLTDIISERSLNVSGGKTVTFEMNGNTLSFDKQNVSLGVYTSGKLIVKNGTISGSKWGVRVYGLTDSVLELQNATVVGDIGIQIESNGNIIAKDSTITGRKTYGLYVFSKGTANIDHCQLSGETTGVRQFSGTLTAKDSTITGKESYALQVSKGTANIDHCQLTGKACGVAVTAGKATVTNQCTITGQTGILVSDASNVRISDSHVLSTAEAKSAVSAAKASKVLVERSKIEAVGGVALSKEHPGGNGISFYDNDTEVEIIDSEVSAVNIAVSGNGSKDQKINGNEDWQKNTLKITGGSLVGQGIAVYLPQNGDTTIKDVKMKGMSGISIKGGRLSLQGNTEIHATGPLLYPGQEYGDGTIPNGSGIQIEANAAYAGGIQVTVSDQVKIVSDNGVAICQYGSVDDHLSKIHIAAATVDLAGGEGQPEILVNEANKEKVEIAQGSLLVNEVNRDYAWIVKQLDPVAKIGEVIYYSLQKAVDAVLENGTATIEMVGNSHEPAIIPAGRTIVLNVPAGITLDNSATTGGWPNTVLQNYGILTITGQGDIRTAKGAGFALKNFEGGTANLNGGVFYSDVNDYVVWNLGRMTIDGAVLDNVSTNNTDNTVLYNGWRPDESDEMTGKVDATLTFKSGKILSKVTGKSAVLTNSHAQFILDGGEIEAPLPLVNWDLAEIKSGKITVTGDGGRAIHAGGLDTSEQSKNGQYRGVLTISGGDFYNNTGKEIPVITIDGTLPEPTGTVSGGTYYKSDDKINLYATDNSHLIPMEGADGRWHLGYTVTFMDGEKTVDTKNIAKGNPVITTDKTPDERIDSVFTGWNFNFGTPVSQDTIINANWKLKEYTVTFDAAGGSAVPSQTRNYNTRFEAPANPTRPGYIFSGWRAVGATANYDFATPVTGNITLTAQWTAIPTPTPTPAPDDDDDEDDDPTPTVTLPDPPVPLAPTPTAPVTPSTPSAPVTPVTPPTTSITDPQVPLANTPAAKPNQPLMVPVVEPLMPEMSGESWSLVNLLLMLFTALASVWQMLRKSRNRRSLFTLIPAIGALLLFFFTENMRNPMALFNQFTVFMVMIAAVQIVLLVFHAKNDEETGDAA